ncbi:MAG: hypothetical protein WC627_03955 [Legionella sp.]|jgi:hypothetical protein
MDIQGPAFNARHRLEQTERMHAAFKFLLHHNLFFYLKATGQIHVIQCLFYGKKKYLAAAFMLSKKKRVRAKEAVHRFKEILRSEKEFAAKRAVHVGENKYGFFRVGHPEVDARLDIERPSP